MIMTHQEVEHHTGPHRPPKVIFYYVFVATSTVTAPRTVDNATKLSWRSIFGAIFCLPLFGGERLV
jgi:hypothetical protein